jgi:hypothetical protein
LKRERNYYHIHHNTVRRYHWLLEIISEIGNGTVEITYSILFRICNYDGAGGQTQVVDYLPFDSGG